MPEDPRPTPPSGMPAASLLDASRPSLGRPGDISAPKSERTIAILAAISDLSAEGRAHREETRARFGNLETSVRKLNDRVDEHSQNEQRTRSALAEQAESLSRVAGAAAKACDLALEAKKEASEASANTKTVVESALRIHGSSIAVIVDNAVKQAVEPIKADVVNIKETGEERALAQKETNEAVGAIVNELGLEDRVALGRDVKPGEPRPIPTLPKMSRETKVAALAGVFVVVVEAVQLAMKMLGMH